MQGPRRARGPRDCARALRGPSLLSASRPSCTPCEMVKRAVKFASAASPSLLIFEVPGLIAASGEDAVTCALPLIGRHGGLLLPFPTGVIDEEAFPGIITNEVQMVGPAKTLEGIELYEEEDAGSGAIQAVKTGVSCPVTVSNFLDSVLVYLREYDPVPCMLKFWPRLLNRPKVSLRAESFFTARARCSRGQSCGCAKKAAKRISNAAL